MNNIGYTGNVGYKIHKQQSFKKNLIKYCIVNYKNVQITYWNTIINCESPYTVLIFTVW
jgi:hypothetical protein